MQTFLAAESDATCKRNAFVFLANVAMNKAVEWLRSVWDGVASMDEGLQMAIIEVARIDCLNDTTHKVSEIRTYSQVCVLRVHSLDTFVACSSCSTHRRTRSSMKLPPRSLPSPKIPQQSKVCSLVFADLDHWIELAC